MIHGYFARKLNTNKGLSEEMYKCIFLLEKWWTGNRNVFLVLAWDGNGNSWICSQ